MSTGAEEPTSNRLTLSSVKFSTSEAVDLTCLSRSAPFDDINAVDRAFSSFLTAALVQVIVVEKSTASRALNFIFTQHVPAGHDDQSTV